MYTVQQSINFAFQLKIFPKKNSKYRRVTSNDFLLFSAGIIGGN